MIDIDAPLKPKALVRWSVQGAVGLVVYALAYGHSYMANYAPLAAKHADTVVALAEDRKSIRAHPEHIKAAVSAEEERWHQLLIDADLAEYNRKTGVWQMRSKQDIVQTALMSDPASTPSLFPVEPVPAKHPKAKH